MKGGGHIGIDLDQRLCGDAVNLRLIRKAMSIVNLAAVCFAVQLLMAAALAFGEATGRPAPAIQQVRDRRRRQFPSWINARVCDADMRLHCALD